MTTGTTFQIYLTEGPAHWELLQRARAVDNQLFVATVSPARDPSAGYHAWGHSSVVNPWYAHIPYVALIVSPLILTVGAKSSPRPIMSPPLFMLISVHIFLYHRPIIVNLFLTLIDLTKADEFRSQIPILAQKRHDLYKSPELIHPS